MRNSFGRGKFRWSFSSKLKVWLNRSLEPIDVISVTSGAGKRLFKVSVGGLTTDFLLQDPRGGGGGSKDLRPEERLDFFIIPAEIKPLRENNLLNSYFWSFPDDRVLFIFLSWTDSPDSSDRKHLTIMWSGVERAKGKRPRFVYGQKAEAIHQYFSHKPNQLPKAMFEIRKRVPLLFWHNFRLSLQTKMKRGRGMDLKPGFVESISVEGFRGFKDEAVLRLAQPNNHPGSGLTIVVGANNAGKSTVWESFDAISKKLNYDVSFAENKRNQEAQNGLIISINFKNGCSYEVRTLHKETSETSGNWTSIEPLKPQIVSVPSRRYFQSNFSKNIIIQKDWMVSEEFVRRQSSNDQFTGRLFAIQNDPERKDKFNELMRRVLGNDFRWSIDMQDHAHGQTYYIKVLFEEGTHHTSEGLGDGITSLLYIIDALYDSTPDSLIVIDEPELSLHPQLIKRLQKIISEFASDRQIVIFTHSPWLVSWGDLRNGGSIARVHKDGNSRSAISQVAKETIDDLGNLDKSWNNPHVLGINAIESLFLDDGVILVEGQDDVALLPRVYELCGIQPVGNLFGWGVGGGDGLPRKIAALLKGLGFKKVVIILDNDKKENIRSLMKEFPEYYVTTIPADDIRDKKAYTSSAKTGLLKNNLEEIHEDFKEVTIEVLHKISDYFSS